MNKFLIIFTFYLHFMRLSNNFLYVGSAKEKNTDDGKSVSRFDVVFI